MWMILVLSVICVHVQSIIAVDSSEAIAKMLRDVIKSDENPSTLLTFTCWTKVEQVNFAAFVDIPTESISGHHSHWNVSKHFISNPTTIRGFVDMRCVESVKWLNEMNGKYFGRPFRWILYQPRSGSLGNLPFLIDSNVIVIHSSDSGKQFELEQGKFYF